MAIKWSPSNQPSNLYWCYDCGCNVHDTGLSILSHKVNQCKCGLPVFTAVSFLPNPRVNIQSTAELIDCRFDEALCLCRGFPNERRVLADKHSWFDVWRAELLPITVSTIIVDRLHNHFVVFDHIVFCNFFRYSSRSTHTITSSVGSHCMTLEPRGYESTNQDAAQILVDLSSKFYK